MTPQDLPSGYEGLRVGFTAAVSHELRTPLARLLSLLDTAKLPGVDVQGLIDEARAEIVEMTQLVDDILFLSELEQGREVVALGFTELAPYVSEVFERLAGARAARRAWTRAATCRAGIVVPMRPRMLLVLSGTSSTTRSATPAAARRSASRRASRATSVVLEVSDDGAGVDRGRRRPPLRALFRSDRSRTTRGTGLGLAIVKHIVGAADGTAEVEGAPGEGTRFRFVLPAPRGGRLI